MSDRAVVDPTTVGPNPVLPIVRGCGVVLTLWSDTIFATLPFGPDAVTVAENKLDVKVDVPDRTPSGLSVNPGSVSNPITDDRRAAIDTSAAKLIVECRGAAGY